MVAIAEEGIADDHMLNFDDVKAVAVAAAVDGHRGQRP